MTSPVDEVLDAFAEAAGKVPELAGHVWIEREDVVTREEMPGLLILPGALNPVDLGDDTTVLQLGVRLLLYVAGARPSRSFYPLSAAVHRELCWSETLQRLATDLPQPIVEEPTYNDFDGFSGCAEVRYTLRLPVERDDPSQPA
ncbi:hypothetical protein [Paraburkholderia sp. J11-2]|uniref:hypothetical protein n=1 Tax=Paraburkholderia sp. J11-2 TaxID=2805431 RepID=UPI002AB64820|nr:hypothetical protein [Paraburkholderia sp. J11-2]